MDSASAARVRLLDGFSLELSDSGPGAVTDDLPRGVQRLIAHLGLADRPTRGAVAGQLWPDAPEEQAQARLRSTLWRLQKLAPRLVDTSRGTLRLSPGVRVDVREFTTWAACVLDPDSGPDVLFAPDLAVEGELLPGWYDDWVLLERERMRQLRLHVLEAFAEQLVSAGRHGEAIQVALGAVHGEPLRESAHRVLVRAHLAEGNVGEAVRAYTTFARMLDDELGVRPTAQLRELVEAAHPQPMAH